MSQMSNWRRLLANFIKNDVVMKTIDEIGFVTLFCFLPSYNFKMPFRRRKFSARIDL
jgi:hypothetical protein